MSQSPSQLVFSDSLDALLQRVITSFASGHLPVAITLPEHWKKGRLHLRDERSLTFCHRIVYSVTSQRAKPAPRTYGTIRASPPKGAFDD
jgi:hypothetical protein